MSILFDPNKLQLQIKKNPLRQLTTHRLYKITHTVFCLKICLLIE